jgi:Flp pilus assembly protein TadD
MRIEVQDPEQSGAAVRGVLALVALACLLASCGEGAPESGAAPAPVTTDAPATAESPATTESPVAPAALPDVSSAQASGPALPQPRALTSAEMEVYRQAVQAGVQYLNQRRYPQALAALQKAAELQPDNFHTLRLLGNAYAFNDDLQGARETLEMAVLLEPSNPGIHYELAQVALNEGEVDLAMAESRKTLELDPDNPRAHEILGLAHHRQGDEEAAIEILQSVIASDPSRVVATHTLGLCYRAVGRIEESRSAFEAVVKQAPNHLEAYRNLGEILASLGDAAGADLANAEYERIKTSRERTAAAANIAPGDD